MAGALTATAPDARRQSVTASLDVLGPASAGSTDYPTPAFRLEVLLTLLSVHLGDDWRPGRLDPVTRRVERDPAAGDDVRFLLPKVALVVEQGDSLESGPRVTLAGWGADAVDEASGVASGELVRMDPPLAVHRDGKVGFGVGSVVVDLDPDSTPPEILERFGADEAFQGFLVEDARFYYGDRDAVVSLGVGVRDLLVGFDGSVSFDADVDLIAPTGMQVDLAFHAGARRLAYERDPLDPPSTDRTGRITVPPGAVLTLTVLRGMPSFTVRVLRGGMDVWDSANRTALLSESGDYSVEVLDSGNPQQSWIETVDVTLAEPPLAVAPAGWPADRVPDPAARAGATLTLDSAPPAGFSITHAPSAYGLVERLHITGREPVVVTVDGQPVPLRRGITEVTVAEGGSVSVDVEWPTLPGGVSESTLLFDLGKPATTGTAVLASYADGQPVPGDAQFVASLPALRSWLEHTVDPASPLTVTAHSSFERQDRQEADQELSQRRLQTAREVLEALADRGVTVPPVGTGTARGFTEARSSGNHPSPASWRAVKFIGMSRSSPRATATATLTRPARATAPAPALPAPADPPAPPPNRPPSAIRSVGVRVKVERNRFVLLELRLGLDVETELEARLRDRTSGTTDGALHASNDGRVDALLSVVHDPATHLWTERLALTSTPGDEDGLVSVPESPPTSAASRILVDALGAVLILAPVLNAAPSALDDDSTGDWVALGSVSGAAALGAVGVLRTERVTLHGAELRLRQAIPPGAAPAQFQSAGVLFDYAVEFGVKVAAIGLETTRPLRVRYRALGFDLAFAPDGLTYHPIFDTSKGFELDLSDPGLFRLPAPLSEILAVLGARVAKVNPTTVEVDLAIKADLGVVTVDRFTVRVPLEEPPIPEILPSGVRVHVPGTLAGSGWIRIVDEPGPPDTTATDPGVEAMSSSGFEAGLDVSFVPLGLRITADLGIVSIAKGGRKAVAVFIGLAVDFPRPLPLAQSGIGVFSGSALFAMHYRRVEPAPSDAAAIPPALRWLQRAGGEPQRLRGRDESGAPVDLWERQLDTWAFGLGLGLTTMDGLLVTLRGMLVLELPGPRVLVFSKLNVVVPVELLRGQSQDLTVGVLGVLDLDFGRSRITLGLLVNFAIQSLLDVNVPVELFFNLQKVKDWHLHLGEFTAPATAQVLGIVQGRAYFQVEGRELAGWPGRPELPSATLPGVAVAVGISGSVDIGDESSGLYARVAVFADLAASLEPFLVAGFAGLDGELRLWIVGVQVRGRLEIQAPDPTYIEGELCASVDLWLKTLKGCVRLRIGSRPAPPAPPLVSGVALLSHAPVLTAGQGTDRPIDTSLGAAVPLPAPGDPERQEPPRVPIDSVLLVQLIQSPVLADTFTSFTENPGPSPVLRGGGRYDTGGGRAVRYTLTGIRLTPGLSGSGTAPATWRISPGQTPQSAQTGVDLALLSTAPMQGARAIERSASLTENVRVTWSDICQPVAPPACVLWTFCGQQIGLSGGGWTLHGLAQPDPPGTFRTTPTRTTLPVGEPPGPADPLADALAGSTAAGTTDPARVLGPRRSSGTPRPEEPADECAEFRAAEVGRRRNPFEHGGHRFLVLDPGGQPVPAARVTQWAGHVGLDVSFHCDITLAAPARQVSVDVVSFARPALLEGLDRNGDLVGRAVGMITGLPETLVVSAPEITTVRLVAEADETLLLRLCVVTARQARDQPELPVVHDVPELPRPLGAFAPARPGLPLPGPRSLTRALPGLPAAAALDASPDPCLRALQLPRTVRVETADLDDETRALLLEGRQAAEDPTWVDLSLGECERVRLLLVSDRAPRPVLHWLDTAGGGLVAHALSDLKPVAVTALAQLPAEWQAEPWRAGVAAVWTFLADAQITAATRWLVEVPGAVGGVTLRLSHPDDRSSQVVLAVVEACRQEERVRRDHDVSVQTNRQVTVRSAIEGVSEVSLLRPGQDYTLSLDYLPEVIGGAGAEGPRTQSFRFSTDTVSPRRLDPYVLVASPEDREDFVFWGDACSLVFNDRQVLALYKAYGETLRFELRTADGRMPDAGNAMALDECPPVVTTPLQEALAEVAADAGDCVGTVTGEGHGCWRVTDALEPLMAYTLDVLAVPGSAATGPRVLRHRFRTSRYPDVQALAAAVRTRPLRHRLLSAELVLPGTLLADRDLQDALVAAGEQPLPPPAEGGLVLYWVPTAAGRARPHALLVDAAEPLWRTRARPRLEVVPGQPDPTYKRVVPGREPALEVVDVSTGLPTPGLNLVRSTGGTRTVALLPPMTSWEGAAVRLDLQRAAGSVIDTPPSTGRLADIPLDPSAPWEDL